jgi:predicted DNA repair protein MutK
MLWVGGSIIVHGLAGLGFHLPEHVIEQAKHAVENVTPVLPSVLGWLTASVLQAILGIFLGGVVIALLSVVNAVRGKPGSAH